MIPLLFKRCGLSLLLTILVAALPAYSRPQAATNKPADSTPDNKSSAEKKPSAGPFHGKLAAVDKAAKTLKVGKRTFYITSETKLYRGGTPATLDDAVVGEEVSGYVKPSEEGKLIATKVNLGPKSGNKAKDKSQSPNAKKSETPNPK